MKIVFLILKKKLIKKNSKIKRKQIDNLIRLKKNNNLIIFSNIEKLI